MDDFARNIRDLIADEDVTQEKLNAKGRVEEKERVRDNYLILHHGREWGASAEYRMDNKGTRLEQIGLEKGYLVTSGLRSKLHQVLHSGSATVEVSLPRR